MIAGRRTEIKFSTLWETGTFTFQQIRNQDYEIVICLGLAPFDARCWVVPKSVIWSKTTPQHGGGTGIDTHWLTVAPDDAPPWLAEHGGTLANALDVLRKLGEK